jgi:putative component of membrane protein insertase Oxa1/YidC/SpoIIIJ protein YidD
MSTIFSLTGPDMFIVAGWAKTLGTLLRAFRILRCNIGSAGSQPITSSEQNCVSFFDKMSMLQQ